ncbi:PH domain-containing protein [Micromonospora sp. LOL_023]|uniref:PH domain-containing protein n=1 Tax=Micromonospora sp. LOL_023 TaxID=3345418 RepID=UPI003A836601
MKLPVAKIIGAATVLAAGLLLADGDQVRLALAVLAAASMTGWALRDLLVPVRITAGPDGITVVAGFAGRRRLGWGQIEAITVDRRGHRGVRTELLEIDAGESLHLLGRGELGTDPAEVAAALRALHSCSEEVSHPRRSRDDP